MPGFVLSPASTLSRSASGISGAVVNGTDAAAARTAANALRTSGEDPDFTDTVAFDATQLHATDDVTEQFLIEGRPLVSGVARRGK